MVSSSLKTRSEEAELMRTLHKPTELVHLRFVEDQRLASSTRRRCSE